MPPPFKLSINSESDQPLPVVSPGSVSDASISSSTQTAVHRIGADNSTLAVQVTGTFAGTLVFEATINGATWVAITGYSTANNPYASITSGGIYHFDCAGLLQVRLRPSAWTSGVAVIRFHGSVGVANTRVDAVAIAHGTNPTAVSAGARTNLYASRAGVPFVMGGHPNVQTLRTNYTGAQTDAAIVTASVGMKIVVTEIEALLDHACTVDVQVRIGFGAANTPTGAGVVLTHPGIAPGSGVVRGNGSGILGVAATDGDDLRITCEVPTTGSLDILVSYYQVES